MRQNGRLTILLDRKMTDEFNCGLAGVKDKSHFSVKSVHYLPGYVDGSLS
jgi:hypothetical protein